MCFSFFLVISDFLPTLILYTDRGIHFEFEIKNLNILKISSRSDCSLMSKIAMFFSTLSERDLLSSNKII